MFEAVLDQNMENFFITTSAVDTYKQSSEAMKAASQPVKKKVYRSFDAILKECYFVGSLKYGNNFIV